MKEFLDFSTVRSNGLKLAHAIHQSGFVPDIIYVSLRGGACLGNIISEYFKVVRKHERPVFYAAVVARSYSDIREHTQVRVDGWTYNPDHLRSGDRILLVDDIFDSGNTINYLVGILLQKGIPREDIKVAVHDYKVRPGGDLEHPIQPDFYCRKHLLSGREDDTWIHYMSHELIGLSPQEIELHYLKTDPELEEVFRVLRTYL
ncbi:MAG: phosphoribosyltransferase [Spirochaetales bacterium]|jgi:hypoxanthine phosphoribosyltransferase|nr:phosphoribosyltransferase [Spirochaetales bacterium]